MSVAELRRSRYTHYMSDYYIEVMLLDQTQLTLSIWIKDNVHFYGCKTSCRIAPAGTRHHSSQPASQLTLHSSTALSSYHSICTQIISKLKIMGRNKTICRISIFSTIPQLKDYIDRYPSAIVHPLFWFSHWPIIHNPSDVKLFRTMQMYWYNSGTCWNHLKLMCADPNAYLHRWCPDY